jgi:hypothetical protein
MEVVPTKEVISSDKKIMANQILKRRISENKVALLLVSVFLVVFYIFIQVTDGEMLLRPMKSAHDVPFNKKVESYCRKSENKKKKPCREQRVQNREKWDDVVRSSKTQGSSMFSLDN